MSIAENPLTGRMKNSMANFTMYTYKGMNIVRSKAFTIKDPKTQKQLNMRARMSLIAEMYHKFSPVISMGFPEREERQSPQNMFVSANFKTAFVMADDVQELSYPQMMLAKGSLPRVTITEATTDAGGITLNYDAHALTPDLNADDEIIACALLKTDELLKTRQFIGYEPNGTIQLKYPALQAEEVVCCYVFVRSRDGEKASDSVWVEVKG
ncbi:MAG: DUF6266 family protein [Paludibacter sp.]|nr:DUF6266 family protein [Paludibacter sp.]